MPQTSILRKISDRIFDTFRGHNKYKFSNDILKIGNIYPKPVFDKIYVHIMDFCCTYKPLLQNNTYTRKDLKFSPYT